MSVAEPEVRTLTWMQAVAGRPAAMWRNGQMIPATRTPERTDVVTAISAVTSATTPTVLPGGATAYGRRRYGWVDLVLEVPLQKADDFGRHAAVATLSSARRLGTSPSVLSGALLQELSRLREIGVELDVTNDVLKQDVDEFARSRMRSRFKRALGTLTPSKIPTAEGGD